MKKTQVALAALALVASTAVLADGVTVSGSLDAGVAATNLAAGSNRGMAFADGNWNGGSYFTISGTEDAGNGLKMGFTLQTGMMMTNGTMNNGGTIPATDGTSTTSQGVFNRQANINLSGDFGTITVGQQLNQYIAGATGTELPNAAFGSFTVNSILNAANGGIAGGFFTPNAVTYALPSISGLNVAVQTQIKGPSGLDSATMSSASASYALGDVNLSAGAITRGTVSSAYSIGGSMPVAGLTVNLRFTKDSPKDGSDATKQIQGGVAYPFSEAITLSLQHANRSGAADNSLTSIGAYYKLSNTAGLYAVVNRASSGQNLFYSGGATNTTGAGDSMVGLAIGAVKNF